MENKEREQIGKHIAKLRKQHNMSQDELAELIGAGKNNISRIEKGKYNIGFDTLQRVAKVFNKKIIFENMISETRYDEDDFYDFLKLLSQSGRIEHKTEIGITSLVLSEGYESLSDAQKNVFNKMIAKNSIDECAMCVSDIPWCEMGEALENGGYCCHCQNLMEKDD